MLSAAVEHSDLGEELHRIADRRWAALQAAGESVTWEGAKAHFHVRAAGNKPRPPSADQPGP